jgi:uncharacterized protein (DUF4415 family)
MSKNERIVRYTVEEIRQMIARGEDMTDWAKVDAMFPEDVERLADDEDGPLPLEWEKNIVVNWPEPKRDLHLRLDGDVLSWFKAGGRGYQTRINAVLRAFVDAQKRAEGQAKAARNAPATTD